MKHLIFFSVAIVFVALLQSGPARAEAKLSQEDAARLIVGNTISGKHFKGFDNNSYINADGTVLSLRKGKINKATWVFKGDAHCVTFVGKKQSCLTIHDVGGGNYEKRRGDKVIIAFKVLPGDAKGLQ